MNTIKNLWDMVNNAKTVEDCNEAEKAIRQANISNNEFDELMETVAFIYREASKR